MASVDHPAQPAAQALTVDLVYGAGPNDVWQQRLQLTSGATVADALHASGWLERLGAAAGSHLAISVWNRTCPPGTPLRDGDRIELSRPLTVDPKEARRQRYRRDGLRKRQR